jgi:hypothetical protein
MWTDRTSKAATRGRRLTLADAPSDKKVLGADAGSPGSHRGSGWRQSSKAARERRRVQLNVGRPRSGGTRKRCIWRGPLQQGCITSRALFESAAFLIQYGQAPAGKGVQATLATTARDRTAQPTLKGSQKE